jgi:hypothetical protein
MKKHPHIISNPKEALTRMRAHGIPLSLVAVVLTALIIALVIFYAYHDWTLVAVSLFLLIVLVLSLKTIQLIDTFRRRRPKS